MENKNLTKAQSGLELNETLIFNRSQSGACAIDLNFNEESDQAFSDHDVEQVLQNNFRKDCTELLLPELSEPEAVRHFTRLSQKNFSIDAASYPLGSCTMKYNPKINEWAARLEGLNRLHPFLDEKEIQPALKICFELQNYLSEIGGFAQTSLAPSAGAQGEFCGIAMIQRALKKRGENRKTILVPNSAHGTNPATAAFFSYQVLPLDTNEQGRINLAQVEKLMDDQCAGIMITNPNTLGIFESDQEKISQIIHERGGYVYGDGANLNALMGIVRPGDLGVDVMHYNLHKTMTTPHGGGGPGCGAIGAAKSLQEFLPNPLIGFKDNNYFVCPDRDQSMGRIRTFFSNFGMMVRAWTYIRSLGPDGLKKVSERAVLNANYIRKNLENDFHLPFKTDCLHEVVFGDAKQMERGISALDIAKRLIDYGIHPPTMYFPLIVKGALMIEPTETESLYDLEQIIFAFKSVAKECIENPSIVKSAPHNTALNRLDEAKAARSLVLTFQELNMKN